MNDTYGHLTGDKVLRELASLLKSSSRASNTVARCGGEEFIQFLPETGTEGARTLAEKLRALVEALPIQLAHATTLQVTISIGVVSPSPELIVQIKTIDQIIQQADEASYQAKGNMAGTA